MTKANRQTISYLRRRFGQVGLEPNARHGQNFLIDLNLIELLAEAADLGPSDVVLEIGTGWDRSPPSSPRRRTGRPRSRSINTCTNGPARNWSVRQRRDAQTGRTPKQESLCPARARHGSSRTGCGAGAQFKLAANLPYNVATPIISNLLISELPPRSA